MWRPDKYHLAAAPFVALDRLGLMPRPRVPVSYVVERAVWSTAWDGTYVHQEIEKIAPGTARVLSNPCRLARGIVHFFSQYQWEVWGGALCASNQFVVTFYHGKPEDDPQSARHVEAFLGSLPRIARVVTAARLVEERLLSWGVPRDRLVRIPIPVDLSVFRPANGIERAAARARHGIPPDHLVIGSFQKDGVGWGEGDEPKLIKGPDVLIRTIERIARERPVFVLLTGPARGYVKRALAARGIPFAHEYVRDYHELPACYSALDVYLNASREEGGPKGVIEAMATGIPVVSTRVGMAPDLIRHGESGFLADPGDSDTLARCILEVAADARLRTNVTARALDAAEVCSTECVGRAHWKHIVAPLLASIGR